MQSDPPDSFLEQSAAPEEPLRPEPAGFVAPPPPAPSGFAAPSHSTGASARIARIASPRASIEDEDPLRGTATPVARTGPFAIVEALLKSPASVLHDVRDGRGAIFQLSAVVVVTMVITGLVIAAFSPGFQLALVPLKLSIGIFFCALICLPSLHIFSCLSGAEQSLKETWGALLMGVALMGILLVGLAPVGWVFSQATSSTGFMGALHLVFLVVSCVFGLGLVNRALTAMNRAPVRGTRLWSMIFVLVLFQMTTTLRPLVGSFDGVLLHDKMFFLTHWLSNVG